VSWASELLCRMLAKQYAFKKYAQRLTEFFWPQGRYEARTINSISFGGRGSHLTLGIHGPLFVHATSFGWA